MRHVGAPTASPDRRRRSRDVAETPSERASRRDDLRWAALGGVAAAAVGFGGMAVVGTASSFEARRLVEAILPTVRFAASAYVAAGSTTLALMLTLITFSLSDHREFTAGHYRRIRQIAALTTAVIVGSVLLLMFLSFPIDEAETGDAYYRWVYYGIMLGGAAAGGAMISIVLMLFYAVRGLIGIGEDETDSDLVVDRGLGPGSSGNKGCRAERPPEEVHHPREGVPS